MTEVELLLRDDWETFCRQVEGGSIGFPSMTVVAVFGHARSKLTHALLAVGDRVSTHLLDHESDCDVSAQTFDDDSSAVNISGCGPSFDSYASAGFNSSGQLFLKVLRKVGRASIFRARSSYFGAAIEPESVEEALERHTRGIEANNRRAFRQAADEAMAENCHLWISLTFDELHRTEHPEDSLRGFIRRVRERYKRRTGKSLKYVAVVGYSPEGREHAHGLFSEDVDPEVIRECWNEGCIDKIEIIDPDEVEAKVGYMAGHVNDLRVTFGRFIRSRSGSSEAEVIPIHDVQEGRATLSDLIHPHVPSVVRTHLFGPFTNIGFRFPRFHQDEDGTSDDDDQ